MFILYQILRGNSSTWTLQSIPYDQKPLLRWSHVHTPKSVLTGGAQCRNQITENPPDFFVTHRQLCLNLHLLLKYRLLPLLLLFSYTLVAFRQLSAEESLNSLLLPQDKSHWRSLSKLSPTTSPQDTRQHNSPCPRRTLPLRVHRPPQKYHRRCGIPFRSLSDHFRCFHAALLLELCSPRLFRPPPPQCLSVASLPPQRLRASSLRNPLTSQQMVMMARPQDLAVGSSARSRRRPASTANPPPLTTPASIHTPNAGREPEAGHQSSRKSSRE